MKRVLVITAIVLGCMLLSGNLKAQPMKVGGGLVLSSNIPAFGVQGKLNYDLSFVMRNLSASGGMTLFFPASNGSYDYGRWTLDLDGHYHFYQVESFQFYGLGGLNITHYKKDPNEDLIGGKNIGTTPGLNIGGGVNYTLPNGLTAYSEAKFVINYYEQAAISIGLLWNL